MKIKKTILIFTFGTVLLLSACANTDVVKKYSISSFDTIIKENDVASDEINGGWSLKSPDSTERLFWSNDFKETTDYDVFIEFDAKPFIDAGLDSEKLPDGMLVGDKIIIGQNFGDDDFSNNSKSTAINSYKELVKLYREAIGYHEALDHYGIDLGNGNKFEWAKDIDKNDKDIVFVLNPKVFIDAGVDPLNINGWIFANVEMMNDNGKKFEEEKLLKPFDLK